MAALVRFRKSIAALALVAAAAGLAPANAAPLTGLSVAQLRARYRLPESHFAMLDGVSVHYTDEGRGPVVVLLHGSYLDLRSWQDWVGELARDHRVIRIDRLRFGLTGTYAGAPVDYPHEQRMLDAVIARFGLGHFALAGSSSGGIVAAQYADRHPRQVDHLILMNFPLGHGRIVGGAPDPAVVAKQTPEEATRTLLEKNLVDHSLIQRPLVERMTAFEHRKDETGAIGNAYDLAASYGENERAQMLGRLKMPVLVMWSAENRTLPVAAGEAAFKAVGSPAKSFVVVQGAGHMMPLEKGRESAVIARKFIDAPSSGPIMATEGD